MSPTDIVEAIGKATALTFESGSAVRAYDRLANLLSPRRKFESSPDSLGVRDRTPAGPLTEVGLTKIALNSDGQELQDQTNTVVPMMADKLVAVHNVTESDIKPGNEIVSKLKRTAWYCNNKLEVSLGVTSRFFKGSRPASSGSVIGIAWKYLEYQFSPYRQPTWQD